MPKTKNVRLKTPDAEMEFAIQTSTTGKMLFEQVAKTIALREVWYFGIRYTNSKGELDWIKLSKKVLGGHDLRKQEPIELELKIKFYPEDVGQELIQEITKRYFYMEVMGAILNEEIYCTAPTSVVLASYACQIRYGDYNESVKLEDSNLLPSSITKKHTLTAGEWTAKIVEAWKTYRDMLREDAMMEYLKVAQELDMFGVNYFEIKNRKGTELLLGVDAQGLNVYEKTDKLSPRIGFPWSEIRNISFNDKKFIIKSIDKKAPDFIFYTISLRTNKRILSLCMGNHELFMRRRKDDTIEIQQMKAQVKEEMDAKYAEKQQQKLLRDEKEAIAEEHKRLKEQMEEIRLREQELEEKLSKKEQEKEESERRAKELETLKEEQEDEMKRIDERRAKLEEELLQQREEFAIKSAEDSERINEQLRQMQKEKDELQTKIHVTTMEQKRQKEQYDIREREVELKLRGLSPQTSIDEDVEAVSVDMVQQTPRIKIVNADEDRQAKYGIQNKQFQTLSEELAQFEVRGEMTQHDRIAKENEQRGRDKYKTLRDIRQGNTKHRVELFENQ